MLPLRLVRTDIPDMEATRLNKYLSEVGFCSRRAADQLIAAGRVTVNGQKPEMGARVTGAEDIRVDGKRIGAPQKKHIYIAFNKPVGIVCTTDTRREKNNIIDYIGHPQRIFPVGRLDKPSEGLIFLTSDGDIVNKILRAGNNHEKEYIVTVNKPITPEFLRRMAGGVPILDTVTRPCKVKQVSATVFKIVLIQGLNRQIRRMCEYLGYEVVRLKRIRIMNVALDLQPGKWRYLSEKEMEEIHRMVAHSQKTFSGPDSDEPDDE